MAKEIIPERTRRGRPPPSNPGNLPRLVVVGAGPAGLTAALDAARRDFAVTVLEAGDQVGGLAKTIVRDGNGFDIGGHRFFTKFPRVERWWQDVLGGDFLTVRRQSRIYYRGKFFDYPLRAGNALAGLGLPMSLRILGSFCWARLHPRQPERSFEDWVSNRFGRLLFATFFKTYTEKVWGVSCQQLSADWAAQRIKSLSLGKAVLNALRPRKQTAITTLIDQFQYPRRGPGMLWERVSRLVTGAGGSVRLNHRVVGVTVESDRSFTVAALSSAGTLQSFTADAVISSVPLSELVACLRPAAPPAVQAAAAALTYRDFLTVLLVVNRANLFPDNWIYLHDPKVHAGRLQNYGNWSAAMVAQAGTSCLGLEYFCSRGDDRWEQSDGQLIELAKRELQLLGFVRPGEVSAAWVVRQPRAYPRYTDNYREHVAVIQQHLATIPHLYTVGRNGMHKYNNQDHSMVTAMLAVDNLCGASHDLWAVNADDEYHEIKLSAEEARPAVTLSPSADTPKRQAV